MEDPHDPDRPPAYRLHKPTGLAVVRLNGKDFYLGRHGTPDSRAKYDRLIAEWLTGGRRIRAAEADARGDGIGIAVSELIAAYWKLANIYYKNPDGTFSRELSPMRYALRLLNKLYGKFAANDFSPLKLKAVRESMIEMGWSRKNINKQVQRIVRMFRWCVENELITAAIADALATISGLK